MTNPLIPGITAAEQDVLYQKLNEYNLKKASFKEVGAYLVVLPRADCPRYTPLCPKGNPYFTYST